MPNPIDDVNEDALSELEIEDDLFLDEDEDDETVLCVCGAELHNPDDFNCPYCGALLDYDWWPDNH